MNLEPQSARRVIAAVGVALALALAGCGGSTVDNDSAGAASAAEAPDVVGAELAGVQFDVRRDPG